MSDPNTALVTGASAGIGAVYADRLAPAHLILWPRETPALPNVCGRKPAAQWRFWSPTCRRERTCFASNTGFARIRLSSCW